MSSFFKRMTALVVTAMCGWLCDAQTGIQAAQDPPATHQTPVPALTGGYLTPDADDSDADATWTASQPIVPSAIGGYGSSMAFGGEMKRFNYIRGGLTAQSTFDDNPYLSPTNPVTSYSYSVFPQLSLDQSRSRLRWLLNYAGGFTFNQQANSQNQTSQNFNFDLQARLTPHVNVRATQVVTLSTGLFSPVNSLNGSVPGVPQGTNPYVVTPLSRQFATVTRTEINYQFSADDAVGASGGYNTLRYRDTAPGTTLFDTQTENASGFYMHRLTPANWIGASYVFQHLGYSESVDDTVVHSALAFDTYTLKPNMTVSLFVGPQYSDNRFPLSSGSSIPLNQTMWSISGGANYSWQAPHTAVGLGFSRRIADGGGIQGSVQVVSVSGNLRHQFSRIWSLTINGAYASNDSLTPASLSGSSTTYASGGVGVTRQIGQNCFVQAGYSRQNQQTTGLSTLSGNAHHNVVIASFSYQFARPWGQ